MSQSSSVPDPTGPEQPDRPRPDVPHHQVLKWIGGGSYGEVWLARDIMGVHRAIKIVRRARFESDKPYDREFSGLRNFEPLSRTHEGLMDILGMGRNAAEGYFFYIMEAADDQLTGQDIDGEAYNPKTLQSEFALKGRLPFQRCLDIALPLAGALQHLHEHRLVHRDIKPSNIIFVNDQPKLADIGLVTSGTSAATFLGSPGYIAPEGPGTPAADVYALGKVLYEVLTGNDRLEFPKPPADLEDPELRDYQELNEVVLKACEANPAKRYASVELMRQDLALLLGGRSVIRLRALERLKSRVLYSMPVVAVLILTTFLLLQARSQSRLIRQQQLLAEIQSTRLLPRSAGWFESTWKLLGDAARIKAHPDVRDRGTALLSGLDAHRIVHRTNFGASTMLLDSAGRRLLSANRGQPTHLFDLPGNSPTSFTNGGLSALGFWHGTNPVEVTFDRAHHELVISTLGNNTPELPRIALSTVPGVSSNHPPISVTLTPDASRLAALLTSDNAEPILCVWDVASGLLLHQVKQPVSVFAFSPDGAALATADKANKVTFHPLSAPHSKDTVITSGRSAVRSLALQRLRQMSENTHNPSWELAVGDAGGTVKIWDIEAQAPIASCLGGSFNADAVAFNSDGTLIASGGTEAARVWDAATGLHLLDLRTGGSVKALNFSKSGERLAVGTANGYDPDSVQVWDLEMGHGAQTLRGLSARVIQVLFSPDERTLAALSHAWEVGVWSLATGELLHRISVPQGILADNAALAFSPDGNRLAFSTSQRATLWDLNAGQMLDSWPLPPGLCDCLAFASSGRLLSVRAERDQANTNRWRYRVRDFLAPSRTNPIAQIKDAYSNLFDAEILDDGSAFILSGRHESRDGLIRTISAFETITGRALWASVLPQTGPTIPVRIDSRNEVAAYLASNAVSARVLDVLTGTVRPALPHFPGGLGPAARIYANAEALRGLALFDPDHVQPMVTLAMDFVLSAGFAKFDRAGRLLACGNADGTVLVFHLDEINQSLATVGLQWH